MGSIEKINRKDVYKIENKSIKYVEKGNVENPLSDMDPVFAFTLADKFNEKNVKVLLKGDLATALWFNFFKSCGTMSEKFTCTKTNKVIVREVTISFEGEVYDERAKEIVIKNPDKIKFDYEYTIG